MFSFAALFSLDIDLRALASGDGLLAEYTIMHTAKTHLTHSTRRLTLIGSNAKVPSSDLLRCTRRGWKDTRRQSLHTMAIFSDLCTSFCLPCFLSDSFMSPYAKAPAPRYLDALIAFWGCVQIRPPTSCARVDPRPDPCDAHHSTPAPSQVVTNPGESLNHAPRRWRERGRRS